VRTKFDIFVFLLVSLGGYTSTGGLLLPEGISADVSINKTNILLHRA